MKKKHQAVEQVVEAARLLGEVARECVFVGGAATGLLLTDPAIAKVRPTIDVDAIVEVASIYEYYKLGERLRQQGFREALDDETPVICRWKHGEVVLDVMPDAADILGFTNRWYGNAVKHCQEMEIEGTSIRIVTPAYFLGTKLEAFHGRGEDDYLASHDLEDLVALLDGRMEIVEDVRAADPDIRSYLSQQFARLLDTNDFLDALPGHLSPDHASQQRVPLILERMKSISEIENC